MNWMNWLNIALKLTPFIVAGVGAIAGENASGATKKHMAMDALQIATAAATDVDPNDAQITQAAATVTGLVIDSTVNDNKAAVLSQVIEHHVTALKEQGILPAGSSSAATVPAQG